MVISSLDSRDIPVEPISNSSRSLVENELLIEVCSSDDDFVEFMKEKYYNDAYKNTLGDSGFDLYCPEDVIVPPNSLGYPIHLGVKLCYRRNIVSESLPFMLLPRSSTGKKTPLRLSNSVGVIDRQYRGEIIALVDNMSDAEFKIEKYSRLFQIVPYIGLGINRVKIVDKVPETVRGENGFGSSGN